jgi:hypothetical protein
MYFNSGSIQIFSRAEEGRLRYSRAQIYFSEKKKVSRHFFPTYFDDYHLSKITFILQTEGILSSKIHYSLISRLWKTSIIKKINQHTQYTIPKSESMSQVSEQERTYSESQASNSPCSYRKTPLWAATPRDHRASPRRCSGISPLRHPRNRSISNHPDRLLFLFLFFGLFVQFLPHIRG